MQEWQRRWQQGRGALVHNRFSRTTTQKRSLKSLLLRHGIVLVALLLGTGVVGGTLISTYAQTPCAANDRSYNITWGDTLGNIAARFGTTVDALARYNKIANPNLIFAGQHVCIPAKITVEPPVVPVGPLQYVTMARQFASQAGISPDIFVRQIKQESGFNPNVISSAGAIGIAQFIPSTAAGLGINPYDPVQSLKGAAQLMARYQQQYGDIAKALAAYNAGPGAVQRAVNLGGANWRAFLPFETRNYLQVILG